MKKKSIITLLIIIVFAAALFFFVLTRPLVYFLEPNLPKDYIKRFSFPSIYCGGAIVLHGNEGLLDTLSRFREPDIVLYTLFTEECKKGKERVELFSKDGIDITEEESLISLISFFKDKTLCVLVDKSNNKEEELYSKLLSINPALIKIEYDSYYLEDESILSSINNFYGAIFLSLESSEIMKKTKSRVLLSYFDALAAISNERVITALPDWNKIIKALLDNRRESYYTLGVIHK